MNGVASISKKSKYLNQPDLNELFVECKNWLSEIAFWKDEVEFLKGIPHRYIEKITDENEIINLKFLMGRINGELSDELNTLEERVTAFQSMLTSLVQNSFVFDEQRCRQEYKTLTTRIESYRELFDQTKIEMRTLIKSAFKRPTENKTKK